MRVSTFIKTGLAIFLIAVTAIMGDMVFSKESSGATIKVKKIVFYSDRNGNDDIFMMNQDGTGLVQLTDNPANDQDASISPDGRNIVFTSERNGTSDLFIIKGVGEVVGPDAELIIFPGSDIYDETQPDWSPNGEDIVFVSTMGGSKDIWIINLHIKSLERLTDTPYDEQGPQWSPDGKEIVYVSDRDGNRDIFLIEELPGKWGKIRQLTCEIGDDAGPSWHPKSQVGHIVYNSFWMGKSHIYEMNTDNCSCNPNEGLPDCVSNRLTWDNFYDRGPVYSPDGKNIAFSSNRLDNFDIWRMKANGSRMQPLTIDPGYDSGPDWGRVRVPAE